MTLTETKKLELNGNVVAREVLELLLESGQRFEMTPTGADEWELTVDDDLLDSALGVELLAVIHC